jgi:DegV family protein with EDD domain
MLRIVTDGSADMPDGWEKEFQIEMLPLGITFGNRLYVQGVDINPKNFYQMVKEKGIFPKTSLPSPAQIADFYRRIASPGDSILSLHLVSKMSGTFNAVKLAVKEVRSEFPVFAFDSGAGSAALGFMCREARLLDRAGQSIQDILHRLQSARQQLTVIFTLDRLDFAQMSGRVGVIQNLLSAMLNIKPIIVLRDGLLQMAEKVRTRQRSLERVVEYVHDKVHGQPVVIAIVHAGDPETAQALVARVRGWVNVKEIIVTDLSIPVAANLGPGTVGIVAYPVE